MKTFNNTETNMIEIIQEGFPQFLDSVQLNNQFKHPSFKLNFNRISVCFTNSFWGVGTIFHCFFPHFGPDPSRKIHTKKSSNFVTGTGSPGKSWVVSPRTTQTLCGKFTIVWIILQ